MIDPPARNRDGDGGSDVEAWEAFWRAVRMRAPWLVLAPAGMAVIFVVALLVVPRTYTASARILPQAPGNTAPARFTGLAAQFGIAIGDPGAGAQSPQFYADLITSRDMLEAIVRADDLGDAGCDGAGRPLLERWGSERGDSLRNLANVTERLASRMHTSVSRETGVVRFQVRTECPELSSAVARRVLAHVDEFDRARRQTQARAERAFLESQVDSAGAALAAREAHLRAFLEANRRWEGSPTLQNEFEGRQRQVLFQEEVYRSLQSALAQARVEEVRNTPVITVVEPPVLPRRPDSRRIVLRFAVMWVVLAVLLTSLVGLRGVVRERGWGALRPL